jgi:hypothetical protein
MDAAGTVALPHRAMEHACRTDADGTVGLRRQGTERACWTVAGKAMDGAGTAVLRRARLSGGGRK